MLLAGAAIEIKRKSYQTPYRCNWARTHLHPHYQFAHKMVQSQNLMQMNLAYRQITTRNKEMNRAGTWAMPFVGRTKHDRMKCSFSKLFEQ
jgi:hypothetical protein